MADTEMNSALGANAPFKGITDFMEWENAGIVNVKNAYTAADLTQEDLEAVKDAQNSKEAAGRKE